jgi:hypothetical protein
MIAVRAPTPQSTAAIIAGASEWPLASQFEASPQFKRSANDFRSYLLSEDDFGLPAANLLDLFDSPEEQPVLIRRIATFLREAQERMKALGTELSDVIFYYVGHGGFDTGGSSAYFLALRQTNSIDYLSSSLSIASLRRALKESTHGVRQYLVLDCCFAAAALMPYLQLSTAGHGIVAQVKEAFPPSGTALLCASGGPGSSQSKAWRKVHHVF